MSTHLTWFKSSYSGSDGGNCLEVAVATCATRIHVRDSKVPHGPVLNLTPAAWATLTEWTAR
ncbi:DUF397 domain-containing protein [Streptomyces sp. NBC_00335]|uniref:DUF397 domain-containing protein n=1 Tax=unclassified Streptomyces TaxID=2593676 RepID=UPI002259254C|nr:MULTISPECIES: DUF397 domain-containing protein [unclassified Streptomyces]MCX5405422.1 DUF397 domain-containing protein [Streptomyces sp. NBC_00086]